MPPLSRRMKISEGQVGSSRMVWAQSGTHWRTFLQYYSTIDIFISLHGLSGVLALLQYLRKEVRLAGPDWESLGAEWKTLTALWLCAEILLSKTGRTDLSFTEIHVSSIPDAWKDWMSAKVMNTDAHHPTQAFGLVFTDYLNKLPSSTMVIEGTVMTEIWCRPGTTGIIGLLPGHDWKVNLARVGYIFNAILGQPEL
jgi:hypothetical protein